MPLQMQNAINPTKKSIRIVKAGVIQQPKAEAQLKLLAHLKAKHDVAEQPPQQHPSLQSNLNVQQMTQSFEFRPATFNEPLPQQTLNQPQPQITQRQTRSMLSPSALLTQLSTTKTQPAQPQKPAPKGGLRDQIQRLRQRDDEPDLACMIQKPQMSDIDTQITQLKSQNYQNQHSSPAQQTKQSQPKIKLMKNQKQIEVVSLPSWPLDSPKPRGSPHKSLKDVKRTDSSTQKMYEILGLFNDLEGEEPEKIATIVHSQVKQSPKQDIARLFQQMEQQVSKVASPKLKPSQKGSKIIQMIEERPRDFASGLSMFASEAQPIQKPTYQIPTTESIISKIQSVKQQISKPTTMQKSTNAALAKIQELNNRGDDELTFLNQMRDSLKAEQKKLQIKPESKMNEQLMRLKSLIGEPIEKPEAQEHPNEIEHEIQTKFQEVEKQDVVQSQLSGDLPLVSIESHHKLIRSSPSRVTPEQFFKTPKELEIQFGQEQILQLVKIDFYNDHGQLIMRIMNRQSDITLERLIFALLTFNRHNEVVEVKTEELGPQLSKRDRLLTARHQQKEWTMVLPGVEYDQWVRCLDQVGK